MQTSTSLLHILGGGSNWSLLTGSHCKLQTSTSLLHILGQGESNYSHCKVKTSTFTTSYHGGGGPTTVTTKYKLQLHYLTSWGESDCSHCKVQTSTLLLYYPVGVQLQSLQSANFNFTTSHPTYTSCSTCVERI